MGWQATGAFRSLDDDMSGDGAEMGTKLEEIDISQVQETRV
jgi:hypothetical protein